MWYILVVVSHSHVCVGWWKTTHGSFVVTQCQNIVIQNGNSYLLEVTQYTKNGDWSLEMIGMYALCILYDTMCCFPWTLLIDNIWSYHLTHQQIQNSKVHQKSSQIPFDSCFFFRVVIRALEHLISSTPYLVFSIVQWKLPRKYFAIDTFKCESRVMRVDTAVMFTTTHSHLKSWFPRPEWRQFKIDVSWPEWSTCWTSPAISFKKYSIV